MAPPPTMLVHRARRNLTPPRTTSAHWPGMTASTGEREVLVVAGPGDTQDLILSAAAAQDLVGRVVTDLDRLAGRWRDAVTVFVADTHAEQVASRALPHRDGVYLVGSDELTLSSWSVPLGARVILLPEGGAWLGAVLDEGTTRARAPVVALVGGSGGLGASTLACALAYRAARLPGGAALVDLDALGGGIDLLLGAEQVDGWRWPRLNAADGHLGDLRPYLPVVDGVSVVSMSRGPGLDLAREPLAAIVGSLRRTHGLVVMDTGRSLTAAAREGMRLASRRLLLVSGRIRGVAAARQFVRAHQLEQVDLVLRRSTRGSLPAEVVADALGFPVIAEIPDDPRLVGAAEQGEPPGRSARRGYTRMCDRLLSRVLQGVGDG